jgi:MFS family permease
VSNPYCQTTRNILDLTLIIRQIVGALICGQLSDLIGRKKTVIIALAVSLAAISMEFVATTNALFFGGKFLNGFAVGTLQAVTGTYVGEVSVHLSTGVLSKSILWYTDW